MKKTRTSDSDESVSSVSGNGDPESFQVLRDLLIGPEHNQLEELKTRLDDPGLRAEEISGVLSDAITLGSFRDNKLARALQPLVDDAIKLSVQKNPKIMADAISPALGPGIRNAIVSTILGMIQSLNQILNHSFSIQGLKWRFEALRTRTSFAEVVLLHTLAYQVEQIFLIHKDTGLVLLHVEAGDIHSQDPDLVSGMITAIQDFVRDSFHPESGDTIETLRMGTGRSIWIEQGQMAVIAAVVRGRPPLDLRTTLKEMIEFVHLSAGPSLGQFTGEVSPFVTFHDLLEGGLQFQLKQEKTHVSPWLWVILLVLMIAVGVWGWGEYQTRQAWKGYVDTIHHEQGLIPMSIGTLDGEFYIWGLRDPLANDPQSLLNNVALDPSKVKSRWDVYYSLSPELVLKRANIILEPPTTVELQLSGDILIVKGTSPHHWIEQFRKTAIGIPGITRYDDQQLQDVDYDMLLGFVESLKSTILYFDQNSSRLSGEEHMKFESVLEIFKKIENLKTMLNIQVQIVIKGHTDSSGSEQQNIRLSRNRADALLDTLIQYDVNPSWISTVGMGTKAPLLEEVDNENRKYNRAVSFEVFMVNPEEGR